jgi:hypothetical protein
MPRAVKRKRVRFSGKANVAVAVPSAPVFRWAAQNAVSRNSARGGRDSVARLPPPRTLIFVEPP